MNPRGIGRGLHGSNVVAVIDRLRSASRLQPRSQKAWKCPIVATSADARARRTDDAIRTVHWSRGFAVT
eukprot:scaffold268965_cov41-Prasinocladus_malaysianus.AAC.1